LRIDRPVRAPIQETRSSRTKSGNETLALSGNVAIVGLGGVGARVIEQLARLDVHSLTVIDPPVSRKLQKGKKVPEE
jgi:tRNA A37 threonylcarbamoyladenosine dehydratase